MPIQTPICDFGKKAIPFELKSTNEKIMKLEDIQGQNGTLIMFICNHCPYVKAVTKDIVEDCNKLKKFGINSVAICSNDAINYPEDSFENMVKFAKENNFNFPYLSDETQEVAKAYDAVCTPDFFGYNKNMELQYRGRMRELKKLVPVRSGESDLLKAMRQRGLDGYQESSPRPERNCEENSLRTRCFVVEVTVISFGKTTYTLRNF